MHDNPAHTYFGYLCKRFWIEKSAPDNTDFTRETMFWTQSEQLIQSSPVLLRPDFSQLCSRAHCQPCYSNKDKTRMHASTSMCDSAFAITSLFLQSLCKCPPKKKKNTDSARTIHVSCSGISFKEPIPEAVIPADIHLVTKMRLYIDESRLLCQRTPFWRWFYRNLVQWF
jgi:hypothetical protein